MGNKIRIPSLAILGGGQLGRMLIQKAIDYNIHTSVLDPDPDAPCRDLCNHFVNGSFKDHDTVLAFGKQADVITVEIEHVNVDALEELEKMGKAVYPQPSVLRIVQDKGVQKQFYKDHNIPTSEFVLVKDRAEISQHQDFLPAMQKLRLSGYDGRGVKAVKTKEQITEAFDEPSVLEKFVDFQREISVIVSRNKDGQIKTFPVVELEFNDEANLVEYLYSPSQLAREINEKATEVATRVIRELNMIGLKCSSTKMVMCW